MSSRDKWFAVMYKGTILRVVGTMREALYVRSQLKDTESVFVEEIETEFIPEMLLRESKHVSSFASSHASLSSLMREFIALDYGSDKYFEILDELVFRIPLITRRGWREMAFRHLSTLGWKDVEG